MISILNIIDDLNELMEPVREWIFKNHTNPILWIVLFFGGMMIFLFTYSALQKEK